jgi:hypothetical protein
MYFPEPAFYGKLQAGFGKTKGFWQPAGAPE